MFEECGKVTMLLLILMYCSALYTGLGLVLRQGNTLPNTTVIAESVSTIVTSVLSVVSLLMFASKIPKAMMETRTLFRKLYQLALLDGGTISVQRLMLLKNFAEIEPFYLTVWDFFRVDRGLILSLFGTALTFCILIMQLKRVDLEDLN
ncbi:uncharacterized protein CDAR_17181 [Caerostris darwini]|uniref:Gustatory receptor n=1 Tax=Caerostris darwini TaxID=1538125 RepID=A0AAV4N145_9ARAC|nr:uncharacterized protein CDAR_17181 [Caerostris darwini]